MEGFFAGESSQFRCPGCDRVIDAPDLRPGERVKCGKCKKLMRYGPHLFGPQYAADSRMVRVVLLVGSIGATVWCVTVGYDFGLWTERWMEGFGGALAMWLVVAGCIGLAARTTQNNGVLLGVAVLMAGVALFFLERLGRHVGYDVASWRRFRMVAPTLMVVGLATLVASFLVQRRYRTL